MAERHWKVKLAASVVAMAMLLAQPAQAQPRRFDVPAQDARRSIPEFARQAGVQISAPTGRIRGIRTRAIRGMIDVRAALRSMIEGTGLSIASDDGSVIVLRHGKESENGRGAPAAQSSIGAPAMEPPRGGPLTAQEPNTEIVVTARKREERLLQVPIAVTAFSGEALERRGSQSLVDVLQEAPGVGIVDLGGGVTQTSIRGIAPVFGGNANGFYLDELPFTGVTVAVEPDVRAWDLERVEVLRGPQGTLFGEGSMGGTVRLLTRDADFSGWAGRVEGSLSATEDGGTNAGMKAAANLPVVPDMLAIRVAGTYEDFDGWVDDPANGRTNVNDQSIATFRAKARFQPASRLSIRGSYWLYDNESGGGSTSTQDGNISSTSRPISSDIDYELFGLTVNYDLDAVSFFLASSFNSFGSEKKQVYYGGDYFYGIDIEIESHEFRAASNGSGPFKWTAGLYRRTAERHDDYSLAAFGLSGTEDARSVATAVYGEGTYTVSDWSLDLTAGLRYFHDEVLSAPSSSGTGSRRAKAEFDHVSPRFIIAWRPTGDWTVYASASNGFRSGQAQFASSLAVAEVLGIDLPEETEPDSIWTYELGAKARLLGNRLILEGAVYHSRWKDVPIIIPLGTTGLTGLLNSGGTDTRGVELSATANLARGLTVNASAGYVDAKYSADIPGSAIREGERFHQVPEFTGSAVVSYRRPVTDRLAMQFNLSGQYNSRRFPDFPNLPGNAIMRVDGQLGVEGEGWSLMLFGRNLLNDDGAVRQRFVTTLAPGVQEIVAERLQPRTIGLRLTLETGQP